MHTQKEGKELKRVGTFAFVAKNLIAILKILGRLMFLKIKFIKTTSRLFFGFIIQLFQSFQNSNYDNIIKKF